MGGQLWTSQITGYRRRGTRLTELRSILGSGITALAIREPLRSCPADAPAKEMKILLKKRDYDVAGVKDTEVGAVIGFVKREPLDKSYVRDHLEPITAENLVSEATPLPQLLTTLRDKEFTFVLVGSEVNGIVTRADLNKPPVRVYLFGLISLLEMHLSFWVRSEYRDNSWQNKLKKERLEGAKSLFAQRKKRNQEIILFECLQFCDKRDLILDIQKLRNQLNLGSKKKAHSLLTKAEELRNKIAHSQEDLVQGTSWPKLIDLVAQIESVVAKSDQEVEEIAKSVCRDDGDGLWDILC